MYLTKPDYKGRISTGLLDLLISEDPDNILANASKVAEDTIQSLAGVLYDVSGEFAKATTARNLYILSMALSIAIYNIYQISDDEEVPAKVIKNYDDTIEDLTKISNGKMSLSLPPVIVEILPTGTGSGDEDVPTEGHGLRRFGSAPRRTHNI